MGTMKPKQTKKIQQGERCTPGAQVEILLENMGTWLDNGARRLVIAQWKFVVGLLFLEYILCHGFSQPVPP